MDDIRENTLQLARRSAVVIYVAQNTPVYEEGAMSGLAEDTVEAYPMLFPEDFNAWGIVDDLVQENHIAIVPYRVHPNEWPQSQFRLAELKWGKEIRL
jgi:hypothetical protein